MADVVFKKSEYRCSCGGTRHKCDMVRIAALEARIEELNHVVAPLTATEAEAVKALGPLLEAGDALHRAEWAEAERDEAIDLLRRWVEKYRP